MLQLTFNHGSCACSCEPLRPRPPRPQDEITIGVGTGLGVSCLLQEIAARQGAGKLRGLQCVPASDVAASEAAFHGVPLAAHQVCGGVWAAWGTLRCAARCRLPGVESECIGSGV